MQIDFDLELSEEEYAAIAMFEYETVKRDPGRRVIR
jgi:hypothetical protein